MKKDDGRVRGNALTISWLRPSLRAFRRDIGDRHFIIIGIAVVVAVASVTAVDMFTDRIRTALSRESSALLGADLAILSNDELPPAYTELADSMNVDTSRTLSMRSVVSGADGLQLVELKGVGSGYPLRGKVLLADEPFAKPHTVEAIPEAGTVWVEERLLPLINGALGGQLTIGAATFAIAKILVLEPDRGGDLFNIAPRVMMNLADIDATGLVAPGSRVRYSLLLAGDAAALKRYRGELAVKDGERVVTPENARPEIRDALRRAEQYLGLASLTTIVLAGVAIALAARSFGEKHKDTVALLRTIGATRRYVFAYFSLEILILGVAGATIGALIGAGAQELIARLMSGLISGALPAPSPIAALRAAVMALIALTGFALPPLLNLRNVPPLRVLRSDADATALSRTSVLSYALATSIFVAPWGTGEWTITAWSLVGLSAGLCMLVIAALFVIKLAKWQRGRLGLVWRFGIANIARRGALTTVQISSLGIGLVSLLVLGIVRTDLLDSWVSSLPENAPNQFLINIQADDLPGLRRFFKRHKLEPPEFYPMIRGRLTALNDRPITSEDFADPRARRLIDREFNLSPANDLKPYNKLIAGKWWDAEEDPAQFSVEREIAETLGISLGDALTYRVAERDVRGIVTNLRAVQWDSMQVNFFVEAPLDLLADYPATFITSFRLDPADSSLLRALVNEYPSVTVIDVGALVDHIRTIMNRSSTTIEFVFLFTLVAGILVLIAAIQATQRERIFESALLKTLGTKRGLILRIMGAEFVAIGLIAGACSGCVAVFSAWLVATQILDITYSPDLSVILIGAAAGVTSVTLVGSFAILSALRQPAASVLRYRN